MPIYLRIFKLSIKLSLYYYYYLLLSDLGNARVIIEAVLLIESLN